MSRDMPQLQPYEPGFIESARDKIASGLLGLGLYDDNPYAAYRAAEGLLSVVDFLPGVGDAKGAAETVDAANRGDYATAGLMGAATAAGVVPVLGDAASAVLMGIARKRGIEDVAPSQIYDKRVKAQPIMEDLKLDVERTEYDVPTVSLADYEGKKALLTMADRTPSGDTIYGLNGVEFEQPVYLGGGRDYMFNPDFPGQAWANAQGYVTAVENAMRRGGDDSMLVLPFQMAPSSNDFTDMGPAVMIEHAKAALGKRDISYIDKLIKKADPDFPGISDPEVHQYIRSTSGPKRKNIEAAFSVVNDPSPAQLKAGVRRIPGALSLTEMRLAISDPRQLQDPTNLTLQNVGLLYGGSLPSPHSTYAAGLLGEGLGRLDRPLTFRDLNPELLTHPRTSATYVDPTDQYKARLGQQIVTLDEGLLSRIGY